MSNPGDITREIISHWLRGWYKGYGVRLDEIGDSFNLTEVEQDQVARELYELSDKTLDLDLILEAGVGIELSHEGEP